MKRRHADNLFLAAKEVLQKISQGYYVRNPVFSKLEYRGPARIYPFDDAAIKLRKAVTAIDNEKILTGKNIRTKASSPPI